MKMHESVLLDEAVKELHIIQNEKYIDATLGAGGHSIQIINQGGVVLGIEADSQMLELARNAVAEACPPLKSLEGRFTAKQGNFRNIDTLAQSAGFDKVSGILYDLGISNLHFDNLRGFSFQHPDDLLDMRLDPESQGVTAADLLNSLPVSQLKVLFSVSVGKNKSIQLSSEIVRRRMRKSFQTVGDLLELFPRSSAQKIHPATTAFMALRIAVNDELTTLAESLPKALSLLRRDGLLVVISFHSGEDRIVKTFFSHFETQALGEILTKKPIVATKGELQKNPKARSAKLRSIKKL